MSSSPNSSLDGTHVRERHASSNSTSSRPLPPPNTTTHPISLDALLAQHANAPHPSLAALDQALSERNIFSSQNTQLWKLIEKQRSGYNHVLKELERIRTERDAYRARLQAAGISIELAKKDKDKPRSLRPSVSNATISVTSESGSLDPRVAMVRHLSDTSGPRNDDRPATPPPSQDAYVRDLQVHNASHTSPPTVLQTRSATLPSRSNDADKTYASVSTNNSGSPMHQGRPSQQSTGLPIDLDGVPASPSHSLYPSSVPSSSTVHPPSLTPHSSSSLGPSLLSPILENTNPLNRDSSVSLPDEAKQFLATMVESPLQSTGFAPTTTATESAQTQAIHPVQDTYNKFEGAGPHGGDENEVFEMVDGDRVERTEPPGSNDKLNADDYPMPPSRGSTQVSQSSHTQRAPSQSIPNPAHQSLPAPEAVVASPTHWKPQSDVSTLSQSHSSMETAPQPDSPFLESYLSPTKSTYGSSSNPTFRALPLIADDLKTTRVLVSHSSVRPNDRGKEVLSFEVEVDPGKGKEPWKVEKLYSDVLGLDHRLRSVVGKGVSKKIASLPEGKLWRDHAPAKSDQRKVALEAYLQSLIDLPVKNKNEVIAFLTSDVVRDARKPVMQAGHKEGYLTKRGKNFGGWKTRYFVLQGPVLEYYESRGGAHLGSIVVTNAQIGRQQRTADNDDEKNYRHAFLIIEARKGPGGSNPRHVLCAESDSERDSWVDILVRYVTGTFSEDSFPPLSVGPSPISVNVPQTQGPGSGQPRSSVSSNQDTAPSVKRGMKVIHPTPFPCSVSIDESYSSSPTKSVHTVNTDRDQSAHEEYSKRLLDRAEPSLSCSLPTSSPLEVASQGLVTFRSSSELGHYADIDRRAANVNQAQGVLESGRPRRDRKSYHPGLAAVSGSPPTTTYTDRTSSPDLCSPPSRGGEPNGKVKISGPINGAPIPAGYKFGGKDAPTEGTSSSDRREKAKSRSFWNFGRPSDRLPTFAPRAVFGVSLEESLDVAEIARLPAVVFRCIQYLEAKKADQEEGIYRLSGSSAVIKGLRDRFNTEGDVDLLASDEYWDPHAIAGLLKGFLRELPASILTRDLHMRFLSVIDFVEPQERIRELSHLISSLPIANYSLLRALTAHLILIVQNSAINKMTMRNVGIVFSPTLGIPAGVFSLMLGEFNRVFNVDAADDITEDDTDKDGEPSRRNSRQYSDAAADKLLGLVGRTLHASTEETPSEDSDSLSTHYESGNETTENDAAVGTGQTRSGNLSQHTELLTPARAEFTPTQSQSHAAHVAASRGLNIAVAGRPHRHSRVLGLPASPRPPADVTHSPVPSPMQTARQS